MNSVAEIDHISLNKKKIKSLYDVTVNAGNHQDERNRLYGRSGVSEANFSN